MTTPVIPGMSAALFSKLTAEPRRYGWHATLKAPFKLAPGQDVDSLLACMTVLAGGLKALTMPPLEVSTLGGFLALRPQGDTSAIHAVASTCVKGLQHLAMPLNESELARRRQSPLTPEQDRLLVAWGYPWVLDQFQFHFSLTGPLEALTLEQRDALVRAAQAHFGPLPTCRFAHLSLFVEPTLGADFQLRGSVRLPG